jgi:hypothetical protein
VATGDKARVQEVLGKIKVIGGFKKSNNII